MVDAKLKRMPYGEYLGAVALALTVGEGDETEARSDLAHLLAGRIMPGIGCIYLESVPWGTGWWSDVLWAAQSHPAVEQHGRPWVAVHQLDDPSWTAGDIHWTMDASYLLAERMNEETLAKALEAVPPFPKVIDLFVRPKRENVEPGLLDMVHGFVRALRPAQLLLPAEEVDESVLTAVARCESSWVLVTS